jgi:hypothetical protein
VEPFFTMIRDIEVREILFAKNIFWFFQFQSNLDEAFILRRDAKERCCFEVF